MYISGEKLCLVVHPTENVNSAYIYTHAPCIISPVERLNKQAWLKVKHLLHSVIAANSETLSHWCSFPKGTIQQQRAIDST